MNTRSPLDYRNEYGSNFRNQRIADIYERYQKRLKENNALDFDDLLVKMVDFISDQSRCVRALSGQVSVYHGG